MVTSTNLSYLTPAVRVYIGDLDSTAYSDVVIYTALVSAVKFLQQKWGNRYLIYTSGMLVNGTTVNTPDGTCTLDSVPNENNAFRNCAVTFTSVAPPIIDQTDETPIILATSILLRRVKITSNVNTFSSWSTPDLSFSNISNGKLLLDMLRADEAFLDAYFKKKLGRSQKSGWPLAVPTQILPLQPSTQYLRPELLYIET